MQRHRSILKTSKFAVEVCREDRDDFIVVRLWSGDGKKMVHHHLKPKQALEYAYAIIRAIDMPR